MSGCVSEEKFDAVSDRARLTKLFNDTRKRLVETGTRNRLIHVNRANVRGNVLNIVNERSDDVYSILADHKVMSFLALGRDKDDEVGQLRLANAGDQGFSEDRYKDSRLETRLGPDALAKKLIKLAREARTVEEEQGVNVLYLAMGFVTWFEDKNSGIPREAPLVLLPVELNRNQKTSTYDIKIRDEDLLTNLPLQQRFKEDFGIELPDVEISDDWKPSDYFEQVQQIIANRPNWKIDRDGIQLGFFSFSKLLMYLDLAIEAWPDGALGTHALTRGLLAGGFENEDPLFAPEDRLDTVLPPEKIFHVVDADASQAQVIEEVRSGRNLVVQGPPGTGKSQTITNIIAAAAREGKRVLFVAEKMAALSVVHDRLKKVGLRDICLELHSRSANKKIVLAELARTLSAAQSAPSQPDAPTALTSARDKLNTIAEAIHEPIGETGETAYSVLSRQARYIGAGASAPSLAAECVEKLGRAEETAFAALVSDYAEIIGKEGTQHPFYGTRNLDLQPVELARLSPLLGAAAESSRDLAAALRVAQTETGTDLPSTARSADRVIDLLTRVRGMPPGSASVADAILEASDLSRLREDLEAGSTWHTSNEAASDVFTTAALQSSPPGSRASLVAGTTSFFARWGSAYRKASRELAGLLKEPIPKTAAERVALADQLIELALQRRQWEEDRDFCSRVLADEWRGEWTNFVGLLAVAQWGENLSASDIATAHDSLISLGSRPHDLSKLIDTLSAARMRFGETVDLVVRMLDLDPQSFPGSSTFATDLDALSARLASMASSGGRYPTWAELERLRHKIEAAGLGALSDRVRTNELDGPAAVTELRFARAEALWRMALQRSSTLRELSAIKRHEIVARFATLERQRLSQNVDGVLARHLAQVPRGAQGEMGIIRGEIAKKARHIAIRRLIGRAGTAIQRIKPVLLMSPISVAQFLPPGSLSFDLLVIDEASQVRPEDALGVIARANQIVVVGDQKQLPPSSFFDRLLADEDQEDEEDEGPDDPLGGAAKVGEMESILTLCEARGLSSRMLKWHYRSRDPSLIEVSNHEFYENELVLPPSPLQRDPRYGLCFTHVNGIYDRGGKRDNRKEAEAIVARIAEHARANPSLSLGVVTFSFAQRNLITELLEFARRTDAALDRFLREGQAEDVFVKNIENVQGDERDVILVSVGYGPSVPGGRPPSSFGPVNSEGGERRLNVLFTRARVRCEVFASFDPAELDPTRSRGDGPRILKRFLDFAKNGKIDDSSPTGECADTPFEEDVADVVRSLGFLADPQVGSTGFKIDIGVRHPDRPGAYILAIECDGATYHSALWARERDRLRQDVLEHLGWRFHRIWSTDWFYNRVGEIKRLKAALADAKQRAEEGIKVAGANKERSVPGEAPKAEPTTFEIPEVLVRQMPVYQRAVFPTKSWQEPHDVAIWTLAELALKIVEGEGPIHQDEVARRIAACFGKEKAGSRILAASLRALRTARQKAEDLRNDGEFWFTSAQATKPPVRDRSAEFGATLKAASISMLEIEAALKIARDDNAGGDGPELIRTAARLLGFKRVGPDLQSRIAAGLAALS